MVVVKGEMQISEFTSRPGGYRAQRPTWAIIQKVNKQNRLFISSQILAQKRSRNGVAAIQHSASAYS